MNIAIKEPKITIIDDIHKGLLLRRKGLLARAFNSDFNAAIIPDAHAKVIRDRDKRILPYLEQMFSSDDDYWEHVLRANCVNGELYAPEILWSRQPAFRERRGEQASGAPKKALQYFGMSESFGQIVQTLSDFSTFVRPVLGRYYSVSILNKPGRRSLEEEMHRDGNGGVKNYLVASMAIEKDAPATVIKKGRELIRPPKGSAVLMDDMVEHSTEEYGTFRPILLAIKLPKPTLF